MRQSQSAAVQPHKEGSLRAQRPDGRDLLRAEGDQRLDVALHIGKHLAAPLLPVPEGGNSRNRGKNRSIVKLIGLEIRIESLPQGRIRHNRIRTYHTGDVESLGRGGKSDAACGRLGADSGKRDMLETPQRHIGMDFVGNHDDAV